VQGVGFRPFIHRLASQLILTGWINNTAQGLVIEVEGRRAALESFLFRLEDEMPPRCFLHSMESVWLDTVGYTGFEIRVSEDAGPRTAFIMPDIATCPDCLAEIFNPANRRYLYPFTNCTNCGPRFSIIESLPYDRRNTSMRKFPMCRHCQAEFRHPRDRRFHAQPNACPECGPRLSIWDRRGKPFASRHEALLAAATAIKQGKILAVKGLGGFHLVVNALDERAVARLRQLKQREEKPFALMFPSVESVLELCEATPPEKRLLEAPEAPIVLLRRIKVFGRPGPGSLAGSIAPGNPCLGVMLPYTPLHHLLLREVGGPIVATSGNLSDEPICTEEMDAFKRLGTIAELFLMHDRPIVRPVDDSVVRVVLGRELVLRRARGYTPLPVSVPEGVGVEPEDVPTILAVGGHLKNTIALGIGPLAFVSQHIGDLETEPAFNAFQRTTADFRRLYEARPAVIAADAHPDYLSAKWARESVENWAPLPALAATPPPPPLTAPDDSPLRIRSAMAPVETPAKPAAEPAPVAELPPPLASEPAPRLVTVQHHLAHILSCMAENELSPPVLGVAWDGTGYGPDGTIWGGEFLSVTAGGWQRVAHLRTFPLPGGDAAVREPRRAALGLLFELLGEAVFERQDLAPVRAFTAEELGTLRTMLVRGLNSPRTSSLGRLFDAVASLIGLRQQLRFEGQAAMDLEFALEVGRSGLSYPLPLTPVPDGPALLDWAPLVQALIADAGAPATPGAMSSKFHHALVDGLVAVAQHIGGERVVLSGGCFQNRYLTERAVTKLQEAGFRPYWHQRVPPNDGGLALGQLAAVRLGLA
jgi:hydrogenase maturation protein HypF